MKLVVATLELEEETVGGAGENLAIISTSSSYDETKTENSVAEKTSWASCMQTDDVEVSMLFELRAKRKRKKKTLKTKTPTHQLTLQYSAGRFTFELDGIPTQLPRVSGH